MKLGGTAVMELKGSRKEEAASKRREPECKELGDKEPEHKEAEHKEPEHKEPEHKKPKHKKPEHKKPEYKEAENKEPEYKESEYKKSGERGTENKLEEKGKKSGIVWLKSLDVACSMYSRIPVPQVEWTEEAMKYALCFFPVVGVVIGAVMSAFMYLAFRMGLGTVSRTCLGTVIPLLITGGIHMDGFLDTVDARSSCQTRERKLEILKDPHTGAFAIIGCAVYLLIYLAVFSELKRTSFPAAAAVYVLARALSGWSVVSFPKAKKDGLASTFAVSARQRIVQAAMVIWAAAAGVFLLYFGGIRMGGSMLAAAAASMCWYHHMAIKEFGGMTGDLAGYFLQVCELAMMCAAVVFG